MSRRCFSETPIESSSITLGGSEAHHLLHVLRASVGTRVTLFDGSGDEFDAEVVRCKRAEVDLVVHSREQVNRELPYPLTLGVPLPKGDRQRWIVEKATELGVTRLVPLVTQHSVGAGEKHIPEKLFRYVIEASKQCGRNRLMDIAEPRSWIEWLDASLAAPDSRVPLKLVAHPTGRPIAMANDDVAAAAYIAVGPEGGLTEAEVAEATARDWEVVTLGPRILRIETTAVVLVARLILRRSPASHTPTPPREF